MPGFSVHHQLLELTQTHVHLVGDAIQPSHPLSSPSLPTFSLSQSQVSSLHQVAKVLEFQLQHQSFQWIFRTDFLEDGLVASPCSPRDSQESSNTTFQKHQFFSVCLVAVFLGLENSIVHGVTKSQIWLSDLHTHIHTHTHTHTQSLRTLFDPQSYFHQELYNNKFIEHHYLLTLLYSCH